MSAGTQRLDPLTSLRFFAAAMIVLAHGAPLFGFAAVKNHFQLGQGVSFFFVLSGFVLAYNYPVLPDRATVLRFLVARFAVLYLNPAVRLLEFSAGIATAMIVLRWRETEPAWSAVQWLVLETAALAAIAIALVVVVDPASFLLTFGLPAAYYLNKEGLWLLWAALIAIFAMSRGPVARALSTPVLVFLGEISFALYLVHHILVGYLEPYAATMLPRASITFIGYWAISIFLSALLYLGVERPLRTAIVGWWDRKSGRARVPGSPASRTQSRRRAIAPGAALLLSVIILAMVALRPPTNDDLSEKQARGFLAAPFSLVVRDGGEFRNGLRVLAARLSESSDPDTTITILIESREKIHAHTVLALHLNDAKGVIIGTPGDRVLGRDGRDIPAGAYKLVTFATRTSLINVTHSLGIAAYRDVNQLYAVTGTTSDWGGRRLLIALPR